MKRIRFFCTTLLVFTLAANGTLHAQSDLQINKVFEQFGKKKGVVMVELTNEALGNYHFTHFKSITIRDNPVAGNVVRNCLSKDKEGAKKIKQVIANGVITSIYLQLPKKGKDNRLILFNESTVPRQKVTLIYIETESESEEVFKLLLRKK